MPEFLSTIVYTKSVHTLVDFYQYIKTVEYLICVAFFASFPAFYMFLNKPRPEEGKVSH